MKSVLSALLCVFLLACSAGCAAAQEVAELALLDALKLERNYYKKPTPAEKELLDKLYLIVKEVGYEQTNNETAYLKSPAGLKLLRTRSEAGALKASYDLAMVQKLDAAGLTKMTAETTYMSDYRAKHLQLEVKVAERSKSLAQNERKMEIKDLQSKAEAEKAKWAKAVEEIQKATAAEALALLEKDQKEARKIVESVYAELSKK